MALVGLLVTAFELTVRTVYPGYAAAFPVLFTALVIAGGAAAPKWGAEALLRAFPFRWIGRWSFSWYLWQPVVLVIAVDYAHMKFGPSPVFRNLVLALLALGLAAATYFIIENPMRRSKRLARNPRATLIGAALLIASCVALTFAF